MALGEGARFEDAALAHRPDADVPLLLAEGLVAGLLQLGVRLGRLLLGRLSDSQSGGLVELVRVPRPARLGAADLPRRAELLDGRGELPVAHPQVVAPLPVEVAAQPAEAPLERWRHRHLEETLAVPQQFDA